ncbi:Translation factor GUF1 -like protein, mitochondrial [Capsicum annuum]|nr:Translation factor GUF1 -like protein, mitochondrial [Capsicum annuum]
MADTRYPYANVAEDSKWKLNILESRRQKGFTYASSDYSRGLLKRCVIGNLAILPLSCLLFLRNMTEQVLQGLWTWKKSRVRLNGGTLLLGVLRPCKSAKQHGLERLSFLFTSTGDGEPKGINNCIVQQSIELYDVIDSGMFDRQAIVFPPLSKGVSTLNIVSFTFPALLCVPGWFTVLLPVTDSEGPGPSQCGASLQGFNNMPHPLGYFDCNKKIELDPTQIIYNNIVEKRNWEVPNQEQQEVSNNDTTINGEFQEVKDVTQLQIEQNYALIEELETTAWAKQNLLKLSKMFGIDYKGHRETLELLMQIDGSRQARRMEPATDRYQENQEQRIRSLDPHLYRTHAPESEQLRFHYFVPIPPIVHSVTKVRRMQPHVLKSERCTYACISSALQHDSYEVSRSLAACQGALLVVDAAQGVQAQTVANFYLAFESNLAIIPVINKIDQPTADPDRVKAQLKSMFDLDPSDALLTSAKTGHGLEQVLPAVIDRIPPPPGRSTSPLRMLLLDSYYDEYKGVICHVAIVDGALHKGDKICSAATGQSYEVSDVGIMHPELVTTGILLAGQVGYIVSGMRSTKEARVGDTLHHTRTVIHPLPADGSDFEALNHAIERLTCNDASVSVTKESSTALGLGFSKLQVQNPAALPSNPKYQLVACREPTVIATIIIPIMWGLLSLYALSVAESNWSTHSLIGNSSCADLLSALERSPNQRAFMKYRMPLREIVVDFYNELKSITSGYASFDYEDSEYQASDLVKLDILLNGQPVDAMATIVHKSKALRVGRELVEKLKKFIDRLSAMRKNVLAKCYGGDVTRKRKLLEKQKEGKKRMKRVGSVDIPQEAFHELLKVS